MSVDRAFVEILERVRRHRSVQARSLALAVLMLAAPLRADQTSLTDAQSAIEANLRTAEGKAYEEKLGGEFMAGHLETLKKCKQEVGAKEGFWFLLKLDKQGGVSEVLLHPVTPLGECARPSLLRSRFSAPPRPAWWVGVFLKISH
jgi:hypothetical protein